MEEIDTSPKALLLPKKSSLSSIVPYESLIRL